LFNIISIKQDITNFTDPTHGKTIFYLTPEMTDIIPGEYIYDFQIKNDSGGIYSTKADEYIVYGDSTRDR
jgi:hypothetical protein